MAVRQSNFDAIIIIKNRAYNKIRLRLKEFFFFFNFVLSRYKNFRLQIPPKKIRNSHILRYILHAYSENPFTFDCLGIITFQNFCSEILIYISATEVCILMNLYGFYAGTSSFSSRIGNSRTENTEKLCTFSEGSLYLYSENPFSSSRSES